MTSAAGLGTASKLRWVQGVGFEIGRIPADSGEGPASVWTIYSSLLLIGCMLQNYLHVHLRLAKRFPVKGLDWV